MAIWGGMPVWPENVPSVSEGDEKLGVDEMTTNRPEIYHLPQSAIGHYEPEQELVTYENNKLIIPVSAGFVYRLAKAPAYIFANSDMTYNDFKEILINAEIASE